MASPSGYGPVSQADATTKSVIGVTTASSISTSSSITAVTTASSTSTHSSTNKISSDFSLTSGATVTTSSVLSSIAGVTSSASTQHPSSSSLISSSSSTQTASSTQTTSDSSSAFTYVQLDGDSLQPYAASYLDSQASFSQLCPSGDCYQACQNFSLLFDVESYVFSDDPNAPNVTSSNGNITLFGVCTNVAQITEAIINDPNTLPHASKFFSNKAEQANVHQIPANISMCLYDTCQATRDPTQCRDLCWPDTLLPGSTSDMDFDAVSKCSRQLCSNVCGLPYANQDVFGVGVLWSYGIQAAVILAYIVWLAIIWIARKLIEPSARVRKFAHTIGCSDFLQSINQADTKRHRTVNWLLSFSYKVNEAAVSFLAAECFFGISIVVAAMLQGPASIDPLNGYALLSVAITGFLPPIFTLMLLHSQKSQEWRPWFLTVLVAISWTISTILFWILYYNLSMTDHSNAKLADARNSLYKVPTCGGYSAMSMCQENIHNDPLWYMMEFYNWDVIPGIQTVWIPWVFSTIAFFVVIAVRFFEVFRQHKSRPVSTFQRRFTRVFWVVSTALLLFGFIYQYRMYIRFQKMKVIDTDNWTFGQIVALMVWAPVALDIFFRPGLDRVQEWMRERGAATTTATTKDIKMSSMSSSPTQVKQGFGQAQYQPLGHSPMFSPYPNQAYSPYTDAHTDAHYDMHPTAPRSPI